MDARKLYQMLENFVTLPRLTLAEKLFSEPFIQDYANIVAVIVVDKKTNYFYTPLDNTVSTNAEQTSEN